MKRRRVFSVVAVVAVLLGLSGASMAGTQGATGTAARADSAPFKGEVSCRAKALTFAHEVHISECKIRSEHKITLRPEGSAAGEVLHAELSYDVDLTKQVALASEPSECGDGDGTRSMSLQPAKLVKKRCYAMVNGQRVDRDDVPLFGEEATRAMLIVSAKKASELAAAINAARDRCQK